MGVYAGLIHKFGSDEGCEVFIGVKCAALFVDRGSWQAVSDFGSAVAGVDSDAMDEALTSVPKSKSRRTRKK